MNQNDNDENYITNFTYINIIAVSVYIALIEGRRYSTIYVNENI